MDHRRIVGGDWEGGIRVKDFLVSQGLTPDMKLLDVGCGCLRVGVPLVEYLEPGNYFGVDKSMDLLKAGLGELGDLRVKLPWGNLAHNPDFRFPWDVKFDMALAQSVFTHLPLNSLRVCLNKVSEALVPGGRFFATFFLVGEISWFTACFGRVGRICTYPDRDPYHHTVSMVDNSCYYTGMALEDIFIPGDGRGWEHPRGQSMIVFRREA